MKTIVAIICIAAVFLIAGCATPEYYTRHNERRDRDKYYYENRSDRRYYDRRYYRPYYRDRYRSRVGVNVWFY